MTNNVAQFEKRDDRPRFLESKKPAAEMRGSPADMLGKLEFLKNLKYIPVVMDIVLIIGLIILGFQIIPDHVIVIAFITAFMTTVIAYLIVRPLCRIKKYSLTMRIVEMVQTNPACRDEFTIVLSEQGELADCARRINTRLKQG